MALDTRILGETGIEVTRLGGGGHFTIGPSGHEDIPRRTREILHQIDSGITYFDVQWEPEADAWREVLKARKTGYTVAWPLHGVTKLGGGLTADYIVAYCHDYAAMYGIERMDVLLWIALEIYPESQSKVLAEVAEAVAKLQAEGLCGHFGFSCHHSPEMAEAALRGYDGFSVMMTPFGPLLPAAGRDLFALARSKGVGTVAMKPFGGGGGFFNKIRSGELDAPALAQWKGAGRPYHAALRWVLANPDVDCVAPGTASIEEIAELVAAAQEPLNAEDKEILDAYRKAVAENKDEENRLVTVWR